jgi:hypothetical protein
MVGEAGDDSGADNRFVTHLSHDLFLTFLVIS